MARPKGPADDEVPAALQPLVDQLAKLQAGDRERVVRAAARRSSHVQKRTIAWKHLRAARGLVSLGGDAIEDTRALYDG